MKTKKPEPPKTTVKALMKVLRKLPADSEVFLEGCDCIGPWDGNATVDEQGVLLCR